MEWRMASEGAEEGLAALLELSDRVMEQVELMVKKLGNINRGIWALVAWIRRLMEVVEEIRKKEVVKVDKEVEVEDVQKADKQTEMEFVEEEESEKEEDNEEEENEGDKEEDKEENGDKEMDRDEEMKNNGDGEK
jgi:hypothetical protein